jgi:hypothetical protein
MIAICLLICPIVSSNKFIGWLLQPTNSVISYAATLYGDKEPIGATLCKISDATWQIFFDTNNEESIDEIRVEIINNDNTSKVLRSVNPNVKKISFSGKYSGLKLKVVSINNGKVVSEKILDII